MSIRHLSDILAKLLPQTKQLSFKNQIVRDLEASLLSQGGRVGGESEESTVCRNERLVSSISSYLQSRYDYLIRWEEANKSTNHISSLEHLKKTANAVGLEWPSEPDLGSYSETKDKSS